MKDKDKTMKMFICEWWVVRYLLSPDLLEVKNADLVNLATAVGALNERLDLQDVVLRRLELRLCNVPENICIRPSLLCH